MHLLFACRPGTGHIMPLIPLAHAAQAAGHEVTFAAWREGLADIAAFGFPSVSVGGPADPGLRALLAGPDAPPLEEHRRIAFSQFFAGPELAARLVDLEPLVMDLRPDVILHEAAELAAPLVAAAAGIPLVTVGFGPLLELAVSDAAAETAAPFWKARGLASARWAGSYRDLYLDPCPQSLQLLDIARLPRVQKLRPGTSEPGNPPAWLDTVTRPLVYLTLGTVFNKRRAVFEAAIAALRTLPVEALVTVGRDIEPASFGPQPETIRVAQYVPQLQVLGRCSLVITHAGAGTMLGALAFGVPLLLLPQGADQLFNASRCCAAGAALMLRPEEVSQEAIAAAVQRLMSEPSFAASAEKVAGEIAAMPTAEDALTTIERLVFN